jgi:hypothetical protein
VSIWFRSEAAQAPLHRGNLVRFPKIPLSPSLKQVSIQKMSQMHCFYFAFNNSYKSKMEPTGPDDVGELLALLGLPSELVLAVYQYGSR